MILLITSHSLFIFFPYTTLFRSLWRVDGIGRLSGAWLVPAWTSCDRCGCVMDSFRAKFHWHWLDAVRSSFRSSCAGVVARSEEHTSELQSRFDIVCRLLLEKKNI